MKKSEKDDGLLFKFDINNEGLLDQIEFLYSYYVAKLHLLRKSNVYITKDKEAEEQLYKDMISACACYIQESLTNIPKDERTNTESGDLPQ